jgi:hypothetical protein
MGELTRIFSCGKSMTTQQLIETFIDHERFEDINAWFPETLEVA